MDTAVLGLGRMGRALASRLLGGGHAVTVWNRSPGRAAGLVAGGGREASSIADAVAGAEAVITMLANDEAVRSVALDGLRASIGDNAVYADCSTVSPALGDELAEAFPARFVALPVLGGPAGVEAGEAVLLAGGDSAAIDRLGPVLSSLSPTVRRYGTARLALTAKLANNTLLLWQVVALAEALAVGRAGGLSDKQLREFLGESPMLAPGVRNRFDAVLAGSREGWWSTTLGAKDIGLAIDLAQGAGIELPGTEQLQRIYAKAAAMGLGEADIAAVAELYGSRSLGFG